MHKPTYIFLSISSNLKMNAVFCILSLAGGNFFYQYFFAESPDWGVFVRDTVSMTLGVISYKLLWEDKTFR